MTKYERTPFSSEMLRAFVAIAEHQHLTIAADRLNRTQSALSVNLRKIETALNTRLFERHAKGMALTADGERLLPVAHRILLDMGRVQTMFERPLHGKIHVGIPDHYDDMIFETVLADFSRAYPDVDVVVTSGCSSGFETAIQSGSLDIAVIAGSKQSTGEILETEATVWAESTGFAHDPEKPIPLAVLDRGCWWSKMPAKALSAQGRPFNVTFKSASFSNLRCAIRAGLGIGVLPARAMQKGMLVSGATRQLPDLPHMTRSLLVSPSAHPEIAETMARKIKDGLAATAAFHLASNG